MYRQWAPYVSVAARRRIAAMELKKLEKSGVRHAPVKVTGRIIAKSFWGKAWCENLEGYSDFENRLPRGRTYVRNGSVLDLKIEAGEVLALVSGSSLYRVRIRIIPLSSERWSAICGDCADAIDSLVELLQGRLSKGVMERVCRQNTGLFPNLSEIDLSCSCPDYAEMCKHVAATLYGVGARLDEQPQLLFKLRGVNERDLVARASRGLKLREGSASEKVLESDDLSGIFGIDFADDPGPPVRVESPPVRVEPPPVRVEPPRAQAAPPGRAKRKAEPAMVRAQRHAIRQVEERVAELRAQRRTDENTSLIATFEEWLQNARAKLTEG